VLTLEQRKVFDAMPMGWTLPLTRHSRAATGG
jgi:hypothetical protein